MLGALFPYALFYIANKKVSSRQKIESSICFLEVNQKLTFFFLNRSDKLDVLLGILIVLGILSVSLLMFAVGVYALIKYIKSNKIL